MPQLATSRSEKSDNGEGEEVLAHLLFRPRVAEVGDEDVGER